MTGQPRLVVFDVDGTLIDSQHQIHAAMTDAFAATGLPVPDLASILRIVGLSLPEAMAVLQPDLAEVEHARIVQAYKDSFNTRKLDSAAPLYPGARAALERLSGQVHTTLGVATGKSRRGLDHLLNAHRLTGFFVTQQVADNHPSKPHPSMLLQTLADTGAVAQRAVMVGDTTFDIAMGRAAGFRTIAVTWGYHARADLIAAGAHSVVDRFDQLDAVLDEVLA